MTTQTAQHIMTSRGLSAIKGWPSEQAVDLVTKFSSSVSGVVPSGTTCSLNSSGQAILGVGTTNVMAMWNWYDSDSPIIESFTGDTATLRDAVVGGTPDGDSFFLVAAGAYELCTSEYVGTPAVNALMTADLAGGDIGKLKAGTVYTDTICAQVSRGVVDNGYGYETLAFWPKMIYPTP